MSFPLQNIFSELDNRAKERILLSTALVTMLLSACFLTFIVWFLCYLACGNRKNKSNTAKTSDNHKESNQQMAMTSVTADKGAKTSEKNCFSLCSGLSSKKDERNQKAKIELGASSKTRGFVCRHQPNLSQHYIEIRAAFNANNNSFRTDASKGKTRKEADQVWQI